VTSVLTQLAAAYLEVNTKQDPKTPMNPTVPPLEANKKLVKSLNKSGQYMAMRDGLKAAIVRTVQERWGKHPCSEVREQVNRGIWFWRVVCLG